MHETKAKINRRIMETTKKVTLDGSSECIQYLSTVDKRLAKAISMVGPITYQPHEDSYSFLVHEIIEQMLSTKVSKKMFERLTILCNGDVTPIAVSLLTDDQIRGIGISQSKVSYIRNLTYAITKGELLLDALGDLPDKTIMDLLCSIRGIGSWTAKMYLIFVLDRQDVLPFEDFAFLQGYKWLYKTEDISRKSVEKRCRKWKPYSSIAARYMYKALDLGFTKNEFHL